MRMNIIEASQQWSASIKLLPRAAAAPAELLARTIVRLAEQGERDPTKLQQQAVQVASRSPCRHSDGRAPINSARPEAQPGTGRSYRNYPGAFASGTAQPPP